MSRFLEVPVYKEVDLFSRHSHVTMYFHQEVGGRLPSDKHVVLTNYPLPMGSADWILGKYITRSLHGLGLGR